MTLMCSPIAPKKDIMAMSNRQKYNKYVFLVRYRRTAPPVEVVVRFTISRLVVITTVFIVLKDNKL